MRSRPWRPIPTKPSAGNPKPADDDIHPQMAVLSRFTAGAFGSVSGHHAGLCPPRCAHTPDEVGTSAETEGSTTTSRHPVRVA
jgi:hypothetical protein